MLKFDPMLKFKTILNRIHKTGPVPSVNIGPESSANPKHVDLNASQLQAKALKDIRIIAIIGLILILADLGLSLTGQSVRIVEDGGHLYLVRPAAGEEAGHVSLRATVRAEGESFENQFDVRLDPLQDERAGTDTSGNTASSRTSAEDLIRSEFRSIAAGFNDDLASRYVLLPDRLTSGESIQWKTVRTTHLFLLLMMTGFIMFLLWQNRLAPLKRLELARRESVLRQLPVFINELVLLLNAGLVLTRAFDEAAQQFLRDPEDDDYFRQNIRRICNSVKNTNSAMQDELRRFAKESGVTELMRISNIISDNISKGAALNQKLERESATLWISRKTRSEERGRLAETKMTLPLSIFLCILIIITIAPALITLRQ